MILPSQNAFAGTGIMHKKRFPHPAGRRLAAGDNANY